MAGFSSPASAASNPCTTGGAAGIGGTGLAPLDSGMGGTGVVGIITGFGSICVNGIEIHYDNLTPVAQDGESGTVSSLAVGQLVSVRARGRGDSLRAQYIDVRSSLVGPVSWVDPKGEVFMALGQTIRLNKVKLPNPVDPARALRPGQFVKVSGLRDGTGAILATRVDTLPDQARAQGVQVTGALSTFGHGVGRIGNLAVTGVTPRQAGDFVQVRGQLRGDVLVAEQVRPALDTGAFQAMDRVVLQGPVVRKLAGGVVDLGYARFDADPWQFKLTLPYVRMTSPAGGSLIGYDNNGTPIYSGGGGALVTQSGLGDVVTSATYSLLSRRDLLLDMTAKIKFGTASVDKGLGTGEDDYGLALDAYVPLGRTTPFFSVGHKWPGEPGGVDLRDTWQAGVGLAHKLSDTWSLGGMFDWRSAATDTSQPQRDFMIYGVYKAGPEWKLQGYASKGFSDASSDYGLGVMVTHSY